MSNAPDLRNRLAGSLYGLLVGDALGCPVEGWKPGEIERRFGCLTQMTSTPRRYRPAGLHSDDGQQALAVCDAVLSDPENVGDVFASLIVRMWTEGGSHGKDFGAHRGTGRNFRSTVKAIESTGDTYGGASKTAGPGAAMRIAPLALYHRGDLDRLRGAVLSVSLVTHTDVRAIAAASAVAIFVVAALKGWPTTGRHAGRLVDFVRWIESGAPDGDGVDRDRHAFSEAFEAMLTDEDLETGDALSAIAVRANRSSLSPGGPASQYCLACAITACRLGLRSDSFEDAVVTAVNLGEDADTVGAMTGAIAGARFGASMIPGRWLDALWARGKLDDRIAALHDRARAFRPAEDVVALERRWTRRARGSSAPRE